MAGLFDALSLGARSLLTAQLAQAAVGQNAANVATPGYSRRRLSLAEGPTIFAGALPIGTGVTAAALERMREALLDAQVRRDSQQLAYAQAQADVLDQVGALLSPADASALAAALGGFWAALGDFSTRPEDGAVRRALLAQAQGLVSAFHLTRDKVASLVRDTSSTLADRVAEVNLLASRLATVNVALVQQPADPAMADERDRIVDRLARLLGARASLREDGSVQVVIEGTGIQLADGARAATLTLAGDPLQGTLALAADGAPLAAPGGEVGGLLALRNSAQDGLPSVLGALDELAAGLIAAVNRVHATGAGLTMAASLTAAIAVADPTAPLATAGLPVPPTGGTLTVGLFDATGALVGSASLAVDPATDSLDDLAAALDALPGLNAGVSAGRLTVAAATAGQRLAFASDGTDLLAGLGLGGFFAGQDARTIAVSADLLADPARIAAARVDLGAGFVSPGDNRTALALAALAQAPILAGASLTADQFLGALGARVGAAVRDARSRAETLQTVVASGEARRQSVSGVNLDEELADMVRFQHAWEAAARYVRTVDEMIQALLAIL